MNIIQIAGRLGTDPETRFTPDGQKVTTLRVACNVRKKGQEETMWWRVTIWGDQFDRILPYFKKGSSIIVVGEMQPPQVYTDRNGSPAVGLEMRAEAIRFSPFGRSQENGEQSAGGNAEGSRYGAPQSQAPSQSQSSYTSQDSSMGMQGQGAAMSFGSSGSSMNDGGGFSGMMGEVSQGQGTPSTMTTEDEDKVPF